MALEENKHKKTLRSHSKAPKTPTGTELTTELTTEMNSELTADLTTENSTGTARALKSKTPKTPTGTDLANKSDEFLTCYECKTEKHFRDNGFTKQQVTFITANAGIGVRWVCCTCRAEPDRVESLTNELECLKTSMEDRFKKLEHSMQTEMKTICTTLMSEMKSFKEAPHINTSHQTSADVKKTQAPLYSQVTTKNTKIMTTNTAETNEVINIIPEHPAENSKMNPEYKANTEKEKRISAQKRNNICIFNLPESSEGDPEKAFKDDISRLKDIFKDKIVLDKNEIEKIYRKGQEINPDKPRPIIMKFSTYEKKQEILELRDLEIKTESNEILRISIEPDRTIKEQKEHKKLVLQLKKRRDEGEENIFIRNEKIIKSWPFHKDPQQYWG